MNIIVTGGAGFIGSEIIHQYIRETNHTIINLDALTYAGNLESLTDIRDDPRYHFEQVNICDKNELIRVFNQYQPHAIMHLAAESHVDRSIDRPAEFIQTNNNNSFYLCVTTTLDKISQLLYHSCFMNGEHKVLI